MMRISNKSKRVFALLWCCIWCVMAAWPTMASNVTGTQPRRVRVGYYTTPSFQEYNKNTGEYSGYSYEYLRAIEQYANWEYEFVPVEFAQGVEMLKNGEIDLMNNVSQTADRAAYLDYSDYPSGENCAYLVTKDRDDRVAYEDFNSFNDLKVGVVSSSIYTQKFIDYCQVNDCMPQLVYYDTKEQAIAALDHGIIDARIITSSQNVKSHIIGKFAPEDFYLATTKGNKALLQELNVAMCRIQTDIPNFAISLKEKYYSDVVESKAVLSQEEKDYLKMKKTIKVACVRDWYPVCYFDNKNGFSSPLADVYQRISQSTGIRFEFVPYDYYYQAMNAFENNRVDMLCYMPFDFMYATNHNADLTAPIATINIFSVSSAKQESSDQTTLAVQRDSYMT